MGIGYFKERRIVKSVDLHRILTAGRKSITIWRIQQIKPAPAYELNVMATADKDPAVLPHGKDPDIDSKISDKRGLL